MRQLVDPFGRIHDYLRISLTDRCNFHCSYCNPRMITRHDHMHSDHLRTDELYALIEIGVRELGISKVRLTGGEPLVYGEIDTLLERLRTLKQRYPFSLGMTTNGLLLDRKLTMLERVPFDSINISLDSLDAHNFTMITGSNAYDIVIRNILKAKKSAIPSVKINCVVMKGTNDHEIIDFVRFAIQHGLNVRFIEYMPFSRNGWNENVFMPFNEMKTFIEGQYQLDPLHPHLHDVAKDFRIVGHTGTISFITSVSEHFCASCNRIRISSDGTVKPCLFSTYKQNRSIKAAGDENGFHSDKIYSILKDALYQKWEQHPDTEALSILKENAMVSIGG